MCTAETQKSSPLRRSNIIRRRRYASHGIKLHRTAIGGGSYRVEDTRRKSGKSILGTIVRTEDGWQVRSNTGLFKTVCVYLVDAVHALMRYYRMNARSARQERFAKVIRARLYAALDCELAETERRTVKLFIETRGTFDNAGWWCWASKAITEGGWQGFKDSLGAMDDDGVHKRLLKSMHSAMWNSYRVAALPAYPKGRNPALGVPVFAQPAPPVAPGRLGPRDKTGRIIAPNLRAAS